MEHIQIHPALKKGTKKFHYTRVDMKKGGYEGPGVL